MRRIAQNTAILLGVNLSSAIFGLLISVAIGRALGSQGLGRYSLVLAWTFSLGIFAEFGLNALVTREVARQRERADPYLVASFVAKTALSLVLIAALFIAAPLVSREDETIVALRLGTILILLSALYGSLTAIFRAFERMAPILILNVGGLALQLVGTLALIANDQGVIPLVALAVEIQALQLVAAMMIYRVAFPHEDKSRMERGLIAQMLRAAFPFAVAGIISAVEMRANYVLLGLLQDVRAVGWYSAASRFTEAAKMLPNAFFGAIFPAFAALGGSAQSQFRHSRWALLLFAFGIALALSVLAQPILALSFGSAFEGAQATLIILAWSLVPGLANGLTMLFLYTRGDESFANKVFALSLLIQLALAFPLIRLFGATGAAFAALAGDIALFILLTENLFFTFYSLLKRFAIPISVFCAALFLRVWLADQTQFDGLYGQDSYAYLDYANALKASLARGEMPPPFFWPIGYPALVALVSIFIPTTVAAQGVSIIASALAALLVYFIAHEILRNQLNASFSSTIAALAFAGAGQTMISSLSAMSDATAIFWVALAAFALIRSRRDTRMRWVALAAFALGCALTTRWVYALLVPVWIAAILSMRSWTSDTSLARITAEGRGIPRHNALIAIAFFLLALSPQLSLMLYHATHGVISNAGDLQTVSWNLTNVWQSNIVNGDGRFTYPIPVAAFYAQPLAHPAFIFPILTPFILLGAWSLRREGSILILLVGWTAAVWLFLAGMAWENPRFALAFFPPLAILVGVGVNAVLCASPRFVRVAQAWAVTGIALTLAWGSHATNNFVAQQRGDRVVANWTNAQLPSDSMVIAFGITETLKHRTAFRVVEIYNESPESLEGILQSQQPIFLLLNTENIESQWKNMVPEINFRTLQSTSDLRVVATQDPYTLFSINRPP